MPPEKARGRVHHTLQWAVTTPMRWAAVTPATRILASAIATPACCQLRSRRVKDRRLLIFSEEHRAILLLVLYPRQHRMFDIVLAKKIEQHLLALDLRQLAEIAIPPEEIECIIDQPTLPARH
jgi:hypothetical protein